LKEVNHVENKDEVFEVTLNEAWIDSQSRIFTKKSAIATLNVGEIWKEDLLVGSSEISQVDSQTKAINAR
jgi:hypothetical protein